MCKTLIYAFTTLCGIGYLPFASGSAASLATVTFFFFYPLHHISLFLFILLLTPLAIYASSYVEAESTLKDPSIIVIDEFLGMAVSLLGLQHSFFWYAGAFLIFRFFDILKPFPINYIEDSCPGGVGIVLDDIFAGVATAISLYTIRFFL